MRGHGVRVPRSSYERMWDRLEEQLGHEPACDALCELVLATAKSRTRDLLDEALQHGDVELRVNEPKIVELLFDDDGDPTDLGALVLAYRRRKAARARPKPPGTGATRALGPTAQPSPPTHVRLDAVEEARGEHARQSAASGTGFRLEHVRASAGTFLKAESGWSERDFEDHIVENWERIDFGLENHLTLIGRQVRLKDTREKVDLLAEMPETERGWRSSSRSFPLDLGAVFIPFILCPESLSPPEPVYSLSPPKATTKERTWSRPLPIPGLDHFRWARARPTIVIPCWARHA